MMLRSRQSAVGCAVLVLCVACIAHVVDPARAQDASSVTVQADGTSSSYAAPAPPKPFDEAYPQCDGHCLCGQVTATKKGSTERRCCPPLLASDAIDLPQESNVDNSIFKVTRHPPTRAASVNGWCRIPYARIGVDYCDYNAIHHDPLHVAFVGENHAIQLARQPQCPSGTYCHRNSRRCVDDNRQSLIKFATTGQAAHSIGSKSRYHDREYRLFHRFTEEELSKRKTPTAPPCVRHDECPANEVCDPFKRQCVTHIEQPLCEDKENCPQYSADRCPGLAASKQCVNFPHQGECIAKWCRPKGVVCIGDTAGLRQDDPYNSYHVTCSTGRCAPDNLCMDKEEAGKTCHIDFDCKSHLCIPNRVDRDVQDQARFRVKDKGVCAARVNLANGESCKSHAECRSFYCNSASGTCGMAPAEGSCKSNAECASFACDTRYGKCLDGLGTGECLLHRQCGVTDHGEKRVCVPFPDDKEDTQLSLYGYCDLDTPHQAQAGACTASAQCGSGACAYQYEDTEFRRQGLSCCPTNKVFLDVDSDKYRCQYMAGDTEHVCKSNDQCLTGICDKWAHHCVLGKDKNDECETSDDCWGKCATNRCDEFKPWPMADHLPCTDEHQNCGRWYNPMTGALEWVTCGPRGSSVNGWCQWHVGKGGLVEAPCLTNHACPEGYYCNTDENEWRLGVAHRCAKTH